MKKTISKAFSIMLVVLMLVSSVPMTSSALNILCLTGHNWVDYVVATPATCTTTGEKIAACTRSGCNKIDTQPIETVAHSYDSTLAACSVCNTKAITGSCGSESFYRLYDDGMLVISGYGNVDDDTFLGNDKIKRVIIENGITEIGPNAFYNSSVTSITFGASVDVILDYAFYQCEDLAYIDFGENLKSIGEYSFSHCRSLKSVTIPDSVEFIANYAFHRCSYIESVTIGANVGTIGYCAFGASNSLKKFIVNEDNQTYFSDNNGVLYNKDQRYLIQYPAGSESAAYVIPESVKTIDSYAFSEADNLESIVIPCGVQTINEFAFSWCDNLQNITIPDSVTKIHERAFFYCSSITEMTIPHSVEVIGRGAFSYCNSLKFINVDEDNQYYLNDEKGVLYNSDKTLLLNYPIGIGETYYEIPDSVKVIGHGAFEGSKTLEDVEINYGVTDIEPFAFEACKNLKSVKIPDSVISVGEYAFRDCSNLSSLYLSKNLTVIGDYAFTGCEKLISVVIPQSVTEIGYFAFINCHALKSVTIGEYVESLDSDIFIRCYSLSDIFICDGADSINTRAFTDIESLVNIRIPVSVKNINYGAFDGCLSLSNVCYQGTYTDWKKINIYSNDEELLNSNIHYSADGTFSDNAYIENTEDGTKTAHCEICGASDTVENNLSHEHIWGEYLEVKKATCSTYGEEVAYCTWLGCKAENRRVVEVYDKDAHQPVNMPAVDATCDTFGHTAGVICGLCNTTIEGYEKISPYGHKPEELKAKPATCIENGNKEGTKCSVCSKILSGGQMIPATGHNYKLVSYKAPSCSVAGVETYRCAVCDDTYSKSVEPTTHSFGSWKTVKVATCFEEGKMRRVCNHCIATETKAIEKLAHTPVWVDSKYPTCYEDGITEGEMCSVCGTILSGCTVIPKGHNFESYEIRKQATCIEDGLKYGYCLTCKKEVEEVIPAIGHAWALYSMKPATCTTSGERVDICKNCGIKSEVRVIEASHSWGSWKTVVAATCVAAGKAQRTCKFAGCSASEEKVIDKLDHTIDTVAAKAPTCTEASVTEGKRCKVCAEVIEGAVTVPAKGHTEVIVVGKVPTCTAAGTTDSSYCSDCGVVLKESVKIQPYGHNMVADTANSKNPTCTESGLDVRKCTRCNYTESKLLPVKHDADWYVISEVKCTTDGKQRGTCKKCGLDVTEIIPAMGHKVTDNSAWTVTSSPTCTKEGTMVAICETCGNTATKSIPVVAHKEVVKTAAVAATCTKEGCTESRQCSVCGIETVKAEKIEKMPHTYSEWTVTKTATCASSGEETSTCTVCKIKTTRVIDRLAHKEQLIEAVAPTCTKEGKTAGIKCEVCCAIIKESVRLDALGHDYVLDKNACVAPTCYTVGREKGTCSRCMAVKDEVLPALGHTEEIIKGTAPDCTNSGIQDGKQCTVCKKVIQEQVTLPALGHDKIRNPAKSTPATCSESGWDYLECTRCQEIEYIETPSTGHVFNRIKIVKEPTCSTKGLMRIFCQYCDEYNSEYTLTESGHTYQNNWQTALAPDCVKEGIAIRICTTCQGIETKALPVVSHSDSDKDNKCDVCKTELEKAPTAECTCNCHSGGIKAFLFKLVLFFQKLLGLNRHCNCGVAHY